MFQSFIRSAALIVSVLTLVGGVISFFVQQADQALTRERESRKAFLEKQLETYSIAVKTVSEIALYPTKNSNRERYLRNLETFWELYFGRLAMVEDRRVERVMKTFGDLLQVEGGTPRPACRNIKRDISLTLAHCARKSLGEGWGVDLRSQNDYCSDVVLENLPRDCPS